MNAVKIEMYFYVGEELISPESLQIRLEDAENLTSEQIYTIRNRYPYANFHIRYGNERFSVNMDGLRCLRSCIWAVPHLIVGEEYKVPLEVNEGYYMVQKNLHNDNIQISCIGISKSYNEKNLLKQNVILPRESFFKQLYVKGLIYRHKIQRLLGNDLIISIEDLARVEQAMLSIGIEV